MRTCLVCGTRERNDDGWCKETRDGDHRWSLPSEPPLDPDTRDLDPRQRG